MENRVLIISSSKDDVRTLKHALGNAYDGPFDVEDAATLEEAMHRIRLRGIDAILLDLTLPDCQGLTCFDQLFRSAPHTPILTLCGLDDEDNAKEAVQRGAQGWLSKGYFDKNLVPQSLRNIIKANTCRPLDHALSALLLHAFYSGHWSFAVSPASEDTDELPDWKMTREWGSVDQHSEIQRYSVHEGAKFQL